MQSDRCFKCGAPVGTATGRCPLCGADCSGQVASAPAFQPAIVGMKAPGSISARRDGPGEDGRRTLVLSLVAMAGLLLLAGLGYAGYKMIVIREVPSVVSPPVAPSAPVPLNLEGVSVQDPTHADPTDVLPAARKRVAESSPEYRLVEISVLRARSGSVDLTRTGTQVGYRFLYEQDDPRVDKKDLKRERVDVTLREKAPVLERSKAQAGDEVVQDPMCVWSAAWRAAVASGFNPDAEFDARYGKRTKTDKAAWTFTVVDKPNSRVEVDGISCAIRAQK